MTTADRPRPFQAWLAHNEHRIDIAWIIGTAAFAAFPAAGYWAAVWLVPLLYLSLASMPASWNHLGLLCPTCRDRNFPVASEGTAAREARWLTIHHKSLPLRLATMATTAGAVVLVTASESAMYAWLFVPGAAIVYVAGRAKSMHQRLYPWCSRCNPHGGLGPRSHTTSPVPVTSGDM